MSQFEKKDAVQAILIADNNIENFVPISNDISTGLIPLVNVPLLDYALETLNRSEIEEVFVFASVFINDVREHIKKRVESKCSWSVNMMVHVIGGEGSRCLGDALRDLDAKSLIRSHFILMGADTVTNANLQPIIKAHKENAKFDKGCAMTVIFKEASTVVRTGDEVVIAVDAENDRLHFHQRIKHNTKEAKFTIPLEVFLNNSKVSLHHNLIDPQIAVCSPSLLALFSDNFDFESRDDFIRGLLINEEILDSRIYVSMLPTEQYARRVSNWLGYQIVSNEVINRWAYPMVPDMGICCLYRNYQFLRNNIYKNERTNISKVLLKENVVIQENSSIDSGSELACVVVGKNCKIGKNCKLYNAFLFDNVIIEDECCIQFCVIGNNAKVSTNSQLSNSVVIGANVIIPPKSNLIVGLIQKNPSEFAECVKKLGEFAYVLEEPTEDLCLSDSDDEINEKVIGSKTKMMKLPFESIESDYNSTSEEEESSHGSPIPDDTNIFLSEVIDSLSRGFEETSNPDFLILEINSSRYAYNMTLEEVNFYVIKALFLLPKFKNDPNVIPALRKILDYFGPVIRNYIKTEDAMSNCLKAIEECCNQSEALTIKITQILHFFYDKDFVSETAILTWYRELIDESLWMKEKLKPFIDWLMQSSDEETSEE